MIIFLILLFSGLLAGAYFALKRPAEDAQEKPAAQIDPPIEPAVNLERLADKIETVMDRAAHPADILPNKRFERAVVALTGETYTVEQVRNYALGANWVLNCVGYEALLRRDDSGDAIERALIAIKNSYAWPLFFLIRFVDAKSAEPIAMRILLSAQYWWPNNPAIVETVGKLLERRIAGGEAIDFGQKFSDLDSKSQKAVRDLIDVLSSDVKNDLRARLTEHESLAFDRGFLRTVGEFVTTDTIGEVVFETQQIARIKDDMLREFELPTPRSILIVGQSGVGKTAIRRAFASDLLIQGWHVFKTSAAKLIADKKYVGEIEGQVRKLALNASRAKQVALYVEQMTELGEFGHTSNKNNSVLDQLWPEIEGGGLFLVSETTSSGLQSLVRMFPTLATVMKVIIMQPVHESEAGEMAVNLLDDTDYEMTDRDKATVVSETLQLSQQYLSHKSLPGSVLSLLKLALIRASQDKVDAVINRSHILGALSQVSGLPNELLDDRQRLDIDGVRAAFESRVIGQDEAVSCLVERIAMLKAGLTDPTRPVGVFLFAGPTGTGKTEIAKTLSDLLFGSPEQMIRLDMSEYQDADSVWRLLGQNTQEIAAGSLVNRIREQPFSVVLLDEFEKAHAKVWDVFLQVFDDGRLSDSKGRLADFRHSIIILTSNLGATINNEAGVGFTSTSGNFSSGDVLRVVNKTFRREFVNRLDQVVVFRPLGREVMRAILHKELQKALGRRGFRTKEWAVEWEDSAIEFLLTEGFTPDLGARPLRRAIERHLLAPLSMTIVQNRTPDGEQFLFVRSNGEALQVEFIDPDADADHFVASDDNDNPASVAKLDLPSIILGTGNDIGAAEYLNRKLDEVINRLHGQEWISGKSAYLSELNDSGFWDRQDRSTVLDRIELIDRIDSAASVLTSLTSRLRQHPSNSKLILSVANRLLVLEEGLKDVDLERPTQAYLGLRLVTADENLDGAQDYLESMASMYRNWAKLRGMRLRGLDAASGRYQIVFSVSGFGSHGVLNPESGLHVYEIPTEDNRFSRIRVRVQVAPVPIGEIDKQSIRSNSPSNALDIAAPYKVEIVRRYRQRPSPLVRDSVRGWRTGRLELVIAGNFDIL